MILPALLLFAQATTPPPASDEIVVIGHRAEEALAACLSRNCPPAEEVEASLQASVEQFADGRYHAARRTLQTAIRRNRAHAAQLPGPVSSLYATLATVAEHEGDGRLWETSARENMLVLRRHLGDDNRATLTERLAFGDNMLGLRELGVASDAYGAVQRIATAKNYTDIAASAAFRRAWLALSLGDNARVERHMDEAVALAGPVNREMVDLREMMRTRIAMRKGDKTAVDALVARLASTPVERPQLLFAKPVSDLNPVGGFIRQDPWDDSEIRFADVGYWIRPDGTTSGGEVLRTSGLGQWKSAILTQVAERRYAPLSVGYPGLYRIDRFTVRGTIDTPIGTRIPRRTGNLTVHVIDLTETEALRDAHQRRVAEEATKAT